MKNRTEQDSRLSQSLYESRMQVHRQHSNEERSQRENSNPRMPTSLLKIEQFIRTIRKSTDLAHRIDWPLLTEREHHGKVIDICQLVINDLFLFLGNSYQYGGSKVVVQDFLKSFYPDLALPSDQLS